MKNLWLSRLAALLYLSVFAFIGLMVAYIGFCDPDTCWHLALGKWMFLHRGLPHIDVFSSNVYTFVHINDQLPLMQHEWLSDLVFYTVLNSVGLKGLLVFVSLMAACSLAVIPSLNLAREGVPRLLAITSVSLTVLASGFRLWVRPEQFSFLCFAVLILLYGISFETKNKRTIILGCLAVFFTMVLWANMHALFLVGIAYCGGISILRSFLGIVSKNDAQIHLRSAILFLCALAGTLFTPWNLYLWRYMFLLAGSSVTHTNKENGPLVFSDLQSPTFWPLVLLIALNWVLILSFRRRRPLKELVEPICLALAALAVVLLFRRLTPLGLLISLSSIGSIFNHASGGVQAVDVPPLRNFLKLDAPLAKLGLPVSRLSIPFCLSVSALICFLSASFLVAPVVPTSSRLFVAPYAAVAYLEAHPLSHRLSHRLLNDSKYGSMMTWDMSHPPDIFIDGRFDSFDRSLVADYNTMRLCKPGWKELLDKYNVGTVFFPNQAPIVEALRMDPSWQVNYTDRTATILNRDR